MGIKATNDAADQYQRKQSRKFKRMGLSGDTHEVPCPGDHGAYTDNCMTCAPRWSVLVIPKEHATSQEYFDFIVKAHRSRPSATNKPDGKHRRTEHGEEDERTE